jgi:hypothetical protein
MWRNWQTRWTQNPVTARSCGFDPLHRQSKHPKRALSAPDQSAAQSAVQEPLVAIQAAKSATLAVRLVVVVTTRTNASKLARQIAASAHSIAPDPQRVWTHPSTNVM